MLKAFFGGGGSGNKRKKFDDSFNQSRSLLIADAQRAAQEGTISQQTLDEILGKASNMQMQARSGAEAWVGYNPGIFGEDELTALRKMFTEEQQGTSSRGRSRLATQKMFEIAQDRPGARQTLLTPRSNASRGILGV